MSHDIPLDSLIVKILGKIWEPAIPINEVRDLVLLLPAAVNSERAAHETKLAEATRPIGEDLQKEINKLKGINGSLKSDIKKLEQTVKESVLAKKPQARALTDVNKLKSINGGVGADIKKLEQAVEDGNTKECCVSTSYFGNPNYGNPNTILRSPTGYQSHFLNHANNVD
jgi:hypothetical protein